MHYMHIKTIIYGVTSVLSLMAYNAFRTSQTPIDQQQHPIILTGNYIEQQHQKIADFIKNGTKNATIGDYDSRANGFDLQGHLQKQAKKNTTEFNTVMKVFRIKLCNKLGKQIDSTQTPSQIDLCNDARDILTGNKLIINQFKVSYDIDGKKITQEDAVNLLFQARCTELDYSINKHIVNSGVLEEERELNLSQNKNRLVLSFVAGAVQLCTAFIPNISEKAKVAINGVCLLGYLAISNTVLNKAYEQAPQQQQVQHI